MNDNNKKTGLKKFFEENRSLAVTIPVFVVLVIAVILVYVFSGNSGEVPESPAPTETTQNATPTPAVEKPDEGTEVVTLPIDERNKDESEIVRNPFAQPYKVSGIIYDKTGNSIAIIEAENKSFIVKIGDSAGEYFKVIDIESDKVVLEVEGMEIILTLSGE